MTMDVRPVEGYEPEIGLLLATLEDGTREWQEELGDVSEDSLIWRPFPNGPSIGAQLMHIAEVEAWWIAEVVGGRPLTDEFKRTVLADGTDVYADRWGEAPRMPLAAYFDVLAEVRARTRELLRDEQGDRLLHPDPNRPRLTVRWIVGHVVQHESYHGGQAVLLQRLAKGAGA